MRSGKKLPIIGWREWVALPELGVSRIKAKIDTGARTASLHAFGIAHFDKFGAPWVRFAIHPKQRDDSVEIITELPVLEFRWIRSSNGEQSRRPVISTQVTVGKLAWRTELTLADRDAMGFRMLLGRHSIRDHFLVNAGKSYLRSSRHKRKSG